CITDSFDTSSTSNLDNLVLRFSNSDSFVDKYYSANARYLSDEAIQEIKESMGKVPDAVNVMASKYQINYYRVLDYMEN
ncbi:8803_t:CDS:2, partial [Entrophospora sp. SA101]